MGSFSSYGLDRACSSLQSYVDLWNDEKFVGSLVQTGAEEIQDQIGAEMMTSRFNIQHLINKLTFSKSFKRNKYGDLHTAVTIKGKNAFGTSLGTILFVLNYGRAKEYGKIEGGYFWTKGRLKAEQNIPKILDKIVSDEIKERGL